MHTGKELEEFVRLAELLVGESVTEVTSPAMMLGKLSGSMREVDVLATRHAGNKVERIIIEARDRKARQGPAWIEQVATKQRDVGADYAIAVSSSGFTPGAIKLGLSLDVEMRHAYSIPIDEVFRDNPRCFPLIHRFLPPEMSVAAARETSTGIEISSQYRERAYLNDIEHPLSPLDILRIAPPTVLEQANVLCTHISITFLLRNPRPSGDLIILEGKNSQDSPSIVFVKADVRFGPDLYVITNARKYLSPNGIGHTLFHTFHPSLSPGGMGSFQSVGPTLTDHDDSSAQTIRWNERSATLGQQVDWVTTINDPTHWASPILSAVKTSIWGDD